MKKKRSNISKKIIKSTLKILNIKVSPKTEQLLEQIFNFCIVGTFSTIIDFLFLYLFKEITNLPIVLSNTLSFTISVLYNYWASLTFVFNVNKEKDQKKNFVLFISLSLVGLLINNLIVWLITDILKIHYMISKVIATIVVMVFNFITRKKFLE